MVASDDSKHGNQFFDESQFEWAQTGGNLADVEWSRGRASEILTLKEQGALQGETYSAQPMIPGYNCHMSAVSVRNVQELLQEQAKIHQHKIQFAIGKINDQNILTEQLVGDIWRSRVFMIGFFRAIDGILSFTRNEWSIFDPRARLHYQIHHLRWEAEQTTHHAIEVILAKRCRETG